MVWQLLTLALAAALVVAGVALASVPAALVVAGVIIGAGVLFIDPASLRKGGRP